MKKENDDGFLLKNIILFVKGIFVGTGAILPGISGGVLCVAFGIYEPMMALLSHPIKSFKIYYKIFIPFLLGWLSGYILLAKLIELVFAVSSSAALMIFAGLTCGSIPEMIKNSEKEGFRQSRTPFVLTLTAAFLIFNILGNLSAEQSETGIIWYTFPNSDMLKYVFCGLIWGLSLVVPGLSSSSLLIFMGLYQPMTAGIASLDFSVILPLCFGLLITVLLTARLVNHLLENHYAFISQIILGFMTASVLLILPTAFDSVIAFVIAAVCYILGFVIARWMDIIRVKQKGYD